MPFEDFRKQELVTYGNPYAHPDQRRIESSSQYDTVRLPSLDVVVGATGENQRRSIFRNVWESVKDKVSVLTEGVKTIYSPRLREGEVWEVANQYVFFANIFLRHIPTSQRVDLVLAMIRDTHKPGVFAQHKTTPSAWISIFGKEMIYPIGTMTPPSTLHEALHYVQYKELMPPNHALTFAATRLQEIFSGHEELFDRFDDKGKRIAFGVLNAEYDNRDTWLKLILEGDIQDAFKQGLQPRLHPQLQKYIDNEHELDRRQLLVGELTKNQMGVKDPYDQSANLGHIRAARAAMLGWAAGDKDVAWTMLWLHSLGYNFDQLEKEFATVIQNGHSNQLRSYYLYPEVRIEDIGLKNPRLKHLQ